MTKSKYMTVAAVAGLLAFLVAADVSAGRGRGGRGMGKRMAAALDLSADQKVKIQKLKAQMIEDLAPAKAKLDDLRQQLHKLWDADKPSKKQIMAKHGQMDQYRDKVRERRVQFRLDVLGVLTADQRAKLQQLKDKRRGRKGQGGRGGGFGFGAH